MKHQNCPPQQRKARPALDVSIVLVLAMLSLAVGRAAASDGVRVEADVRIGNLDIRGGYQQIVEVPRGGLDIDLWSNPASGTAVRPGRRVELFFRTNADCYVTLVSVDPSGRARRLFPRSGDDGWVEGGRVHTLPDRRWGTDLVVTGPRGEERVFALASFDPLFERYPRWLRNDTWTNDLFDDGSLYQTGWVRGDPVYEFGVFCERLVPHPQRYETYASSWITLRVGGWRPSYNSCSRCGGLRELADCAEGSAELHWYADHGHLDFRVTRTPRFRHWSCTCDAPPRRVHRWDHSGHGRPAGHRADQEPAGRYRDRRDVGPDPKAERSRHAKGGKRKVAAR